MLRQQSMSMHVDSTSSDHNLSLKKRDSSLGYWSEITPRGGTNHIPCPRSMHAGAVWGTNLYIFGGYDGWQRSNDLHMYSFQTNKWSLLASGGMTPSHRDRHTAVVYKNSLVVFGGYDGRARVNDTHLLDLETHIWEDVNVTNMLYVPTQRHSHAAVVYGNAMYIFGGYDGSYCGDLNKFCFATFTWSLVQTFGVAPSPRYRVTCVVHEDTMVLHGGHDGNRHLNETHLLHFPTLTWSPLISLGIPPSPRDSHVGVIVQEAMYIFGGSTGGALEDFHRLDLRTNTWSPVLTADALIRVDGSEGVGVRVGGVGYRMGVGMGVGVSGVSMLAALERQDAEAFSAIARSASDGLDTAGGVINSAGIEAIVERPISSPGNRFCHIAVVYNNSIYSFGGYDGSHRLNDFLKYSFSSDAPSSGVSASTLIQDLKGFVKSDLHSDITFVVEGRRIHAHKILCMRCAFFHNMLTGEYMESREAEIEIAEVGYDAFSSLLEFLYSDHCDVTLLNAMEIFQTADRFGMERLKNICECVLVSSITVTTACEMALAADIHQGHILKGASMSFIVRHFDAVSKTKGFEDLGRANIDLLFEVLRLR